MYLNVPHRALNLSSSWVTLLETPDPLNDLQVLSGAFGWYPQEFPFIPCYRRKLSQYRLNRVNLPRFRCSNEVSTDTGELVTLQPVQPVPSRSAGDYPPCGWNNSAVPGHWSVSEYKNSGNTTLPETLYL